MKRITFVLMMALMGLVGYAQTNNETGETTNVQPAAMKYGYLSYEAVLQSMPAYAEMQKSMEELRGQYEAEQKRVEDDFNKKYEEFLDGQASFPKTILQKRQSELQEMLDKNIAFKKEGEKLLSQAQSEAITPLKQMLNDALARIGMERGYAFILNTDGNATPWLNPAIGEDITNDVKTLLGKY